VLCWIRTAAVVALGEYADKKAVPALVKALGEKDEGFSPEGHTNGNLRRAAVRSLGSIGTDDALTALYDGGKDGPVKSQCVEFWVNTKEPKHLAAFLKLYDANPLDADLAAGIIESLLRNHKEKELTAKEQTAAEEEFFKKVIDPARFGPKADLSEGGKWRLQVTYAFRPEGFVTVTFGFRDINPNGFGHGYSVLYRKTGDQWKPVGKSDGWKG
jgi:PBS lyase HEAT-like repeat